MLEETGAPEGKRVGPEGMARQAVGAQERPRENQVIGSPGGPYVFSDKSPLFSGSCFAEYFDVMIITYLYNSLLSGDSISASRVMCRGLSLQCGDRGCVKALNSALDEQCGTGNHHISLL